MQGSLQVDSLLPFSVLSHSQNPKTMTSRAPLAIGGPCYSSQVDTCHSPDGSGKRRIPGAQTAVVAVHAHPPSADSALRTTAAEQAARAAAEFGFLLLAVLSLIFFSPLESQKRIRNLRKLQMEERY